MNKMDDFFNKRLSDFNTAEEGWNVPSDQVWENVKDHLPKPEKKKKRFFFLLFGFVLLAAAFSTMTYFNSSKINELTTDQSATKNKVVAGSAKYNAEDNLQEQRTNTIAEAITNELNGDVTEVSGRKLSGDLNVNQVESVNHSTITDLSRILDKSKKVREREVSESVDKSVVMAQLLQNPLTARSIENQNILNETGSATFSATSFQAKNNQQSADFINEHNKTLNSFQEGSFQSVENILEETRVLYRSENIGILNTLPFTAFMINRNGLLPSAQNIPEGPLERLIEIEDEKRRPQEFGISYSLSAFTFLKSQTVIEEMDRFLIQARFKNLNIEYARWISNRWKFSTGVYLSKIDVNFGFTQFFNYDQSFMNESIATEYGNTVEESGANSAGNVRVSFINGLEPSEGELINIKGNVDISLSAIQVPLFLTHHRRRKKMEFFVGGGIALELIKEEQKNGLLNVFRDERLISSSSEIDDLQEVLPDYSIYGLTGFRYNLTDRINTGIGLKVNLSNVIFSTADVGIYYRW